MTVTSEPPRPSETPSPAPFTADGSLPATVEKDLTDSYVDKPVTRTSPSRRVSADLLAATPREKMPPKNELDADDRRDIRATRSLEALEIQIKLERHRDWLEWQRTKRYLVFYGGLMALTAAFVLGLKYADVPPQDIAKLAFLTIASGISGYGLRALTTKIWYAISSRDTSSQRKSSR